MNKIARLAELLLLWLLPIALLGTCFYAFRQWEPSKEYSNAMAFVFLAVIWLLGIKQLNAGLPAKRAKLWAGALLLCVVSLLTGLAFFRLYPLSGAFWLVFFPGLLVIANTLPDKS